MVLSASAGVLLPGRPASPLAVLIREELRAVTRGRFAWLGAAAVLLGIGGLAAVATQDTWIDGYGIVAYFLAPLAFLPLSAASVANPRAKRFVESVFTAPVSRAHWLTAKVAVLLILAVGYFVALLPMLAVYVAHVGLPPLLLRLVEWTPGILIASVAIGTLIGVLFIGRNVAPPVATGVGILLLFAGLVPLQELLVAQGYGATATGHVVLISPVAVLKNALGFALAAPFVPASTAMTWFSFALVVVGSFALAAWVFLTAQGVESWETTRGQRWTIGVALAALLITPALLADTNYDKATPPANRAPAIRALFARGAGNVALANPGGVVPARCCDTLLNRDAWPPLPTGRGTQQDLLVLLPVDARQTLTAVTVDVTGEAGLQAKADAGAAAQLVQHLEPHTFAADTGPTGTDGQRIQTGWIARVPVTLTPTNPWDIGGNRYPLTITTTYRVAGDDQPHTLTTRAAIAAQVPYALLQMALAALVLPGLCLIAAWRRWRRTR